MSFELRPATRDDLPRLAEWNQQLIRDEGADNPMSLAELEARMGRWLDADYRALVFELDSVSVGYALFRQQEGHLHLRQLFVARDRRREGIGRRAVEILLDEVLPEGRRVSVDVLEHNRAARSFWQALGFRAHARTLVSSSGSRG